MEKREILRVEKEEDVSVIVVGSHGKTNLEEMLFGFRIGKGCEER